MKSRKSFFTLVLLMMLPLALGACMDNFFPSTPPIVGSGKLVTTRPAVASIKQVSLSGMGTLDIVQGPSESLEIEADDNVLPLIETRMDGDRLTLGIKSNTNLQDATIKYHLVVRNLNSIAISGAGEVKIETLTSYHLDIAVSGAGKLSIGRLEGHEADLKVSGAGSITLGDAHADTLITAISGAGTVSLAGKTRWQDVTLSGSGKYTAPTLESREAHLLVSGAGNAAVACEDHMNVEVSGGGSVRYSGAAKVISSVAGAGSVVKQ